MLTYCTFSFTVVCSHEEYAFNSANPTDLVATETAILESYTTTGEVEVEIEAADTIERTFTVMTITATVAVVGQDDVVITFTYERDDGTTEVEQVQLSFMNLLEDPFLQEQCRLFGLRDQFERTLRY